MRTCAGPLREGTGSDPVHRDHPGLRRPARAGAPGIHGQLAQWFGPAGCSVPRDSIEVDARPGGHLRFLLTGPGLRSPVDMTFTHVVANKLLAGEMEAAGVPGVAGPVRVYLRLEFHDEGNGKTRLELRQGPFAAGQTGADARRGWDSSFTKLDALL